PPPPAARPGGRGAGRLPGPAPRPPGGGALGPAPAVSAFVQVAVVGDHHDRPVLFRAGWPGAHRCHQPPDPLISSQQGRPVGGSGAGGVPGEVDGAQVDERHPGSLSGQDRGGARGDGLVGGVPGGQAFRRAPQARAAGGPAVNPRVLASANSGPPSSAGASGGPPLTASSVGSPARVARVTKSGCSASRWPVRSLPVMPCPATPVPVA